MKKTETSRRHRHGGNIRFLSVASGIPSSDLIDFSANINPLGPPDWLRALISAHVSELVHYPDPDCTELVGTLASVNNVSREQLLVGNGATELLHLLPRALEIDSVLVPVPSYADYSDSATRAGLEVKTLNLDSRSEFCLDFDHLAAHVEPNQLVFLGQPNNPTGRCFDPIQLKILANEFPKSFFVVDESFIFFTDDHHSLRHERPANIIVIESMTKAYAIPGLRLGYLLAEAEIVARLKRLLPDWTVNTLAQRFGCRAVMDNDYHQRSRDFVTGQRQLLIRNLEEIPSLSVFPGDANFLLVRLNDDHITATELAERCLAKGIAIRACENFLNLDHTYFRVAVRTTQEQEKLCERLREILETPRRPRSLKKTPAVMFQGTSSNAGKSVLASAMCRILHQDGFDVAPFKAQNMSLNSFVTSQGGEMGRAQVVQAQACRLEPDVRMNPILLKPNSDIGSQVIMNGKVVGNMHFRDYARQRRAFFETVKQSYDELAAEHEVIVLEGAGSPAEINFKTYDIVNMNMARHAIAPVLLVGDIDRGGVFASFVGTMELLTEEERELIAGFVINRFRGDQNFLNPALEYTLRHTGKPVLGIVPFLQNLGLPEEDSVSFKDVSSQDESSSTNRINIVVIDMPHISNFTDFDALKIEPDVHLRVVRKPDEIGEPDALILPGSKNVLGDLGYLRESGFADQILRLIESSSTEVVGICGGFQIIGEWISDPHALESSGTASRGLGLLPIETVLAPSKTTIQTRARHIPSGHELIGYEIHHGKTMALERELQVIIRNKDGEMIGGSCRQGRIWGTYLHGVFDVDSFRRWFVDRLRQQRGWSADGKILAHYNLEPALDRLADTVRAAIDIKTIYRRMGL